MLYENKISAQIQERNYPPQRKPSAENMFTGVNLKALVPKRDQIFSDIYHQKIIKTWTSDRLAEVQGATKVTVQGKE